MALPGGLSSPADLSPREVSPCEGAKSSERSDKAPKSGRRRAAWVGLAAISFVFLCYVAVPKLSLRLRGGTPLRGGVLQMALIRGQWGKAGEAGPKREEEGLLVVKHAEEKVEIVSVPKLEDREGPQPRTEPEATAETQEEQEANPEGAPESGISRGREAAEEVASSEEDASSQEDYLQQQIWEAVQRAWPAEADLEGIWKAARARETGQGE